MQQKKVVRWLGSTTMLALFLGVVGGMGLDRVVITGFAPNFLLLSEASKAHSPILCGPWG
jgi:hypothetical protein